MSGEICCVWILHPSASPPLQHLLSSPRLRPENGFDKGQACFIWWGCNSRVSLHICLSSSSSPWGNSYLEVVDVLSLVA